MWSLRTGGSAGGGGGGGGGWEREPHAGDGGGDAASVPLKRQDPPSVGRRQPYGGDVTRSVERRDAASSVGQQWRRQWGRRR